MRYADGSYRHIAAVATNLLDDPRVGGIVLTARDVNDRKAFEEQLRHRAFHDALTGLANRALFYDRVEHALTRAAREDAQVAVLFVDLDDFKAVNDARGHAEGDRLLEEVARRLTLLPALGRHRRAPRRRRVRRAASRTSPIPARRDRRRRADPRARSRSRSTSTARPSRSRRASAWSISGADDRGVEELLRKADLAMYEAKRNGKRRAELYHAGLERRDGPDEPAARPWFARNDEQRAEIQDVLEDPRRHHDGLPADHGPAHRPRRRATSRSSRFNREPRRAPDVWFAQAHRCGLGYALEAKAIAAALAAPGPAAPAPI